MAVAISRRSEVEPFHAMDVLAQANRLRALGHPVVSLAVGQPSDPAPAPVREAAIRAIQAGRIGYTDSLGTESLRKAIAGHYRDHYGIDVPPSRIAVTTGSSAGFNLAFLAMFDPGDRVAITAPGYPAYRNIMKALGIEVVEIRLEGKAALDAELLQAAHRRSPLKGVLFASPANPTGSVIPENDLRDLLTAARDLGIAAISDEIYHRLSFTEPDRTALALDPDVTVINSFSKYYCMTGWRIGWMVLPERLVRPVERIAQSLYISAPEVSQIAAASAFGATIELDRVRDRYGANRSMLMEALPRLGLPLASPMDGAFYAYCDVSRHTNDSMDFARRVLQECHVAITPGHDFDLVEGHRHVRLSYAGSQADIATAVQRLGDWLMRE
jgi:aspartate/methionine/tyrosine aminotransferase